MAQFLRPTHDVTINLFTPEPLWQQIDEVVRNDADFIRSNNNQTGLAEVGLGPGNDPQVNTGHIVRYALNRSASNRNYTMVVRLVNLGVTIASWTHANPPTTFTQFNQTLTGPQADAITDYSELHLQFDVTVASGGGAFMSVSWAEMEIPDAVNSTFDGTGTDSALASNSGAAEVAASPSGSDAALASESGSAIVPIDLGNLVTSGLIRAYILREGADSQVAYDSGSQAANGQLGSTTGVDTEDPTWNVAGDILNFNDGDYVVLPVSGLPTGDADLTMMVVAMNTDPLNTQRNVVSFGNTANRQLPHIHYRGESATVEFGTYFGDVAVDAGTVLNTPIVATFRYGNRAGPFAGELRGDINELAATGTTTLADANWGTAGAHIGRMTDGTSVFLGDIYTVLIYDRRLSDAEVIQNYAALYDDMATRGVTLPAPSSGTTYDGTGTDVALGSQSSVAESTLESSGNSFADASESSSPSSALYTNSLSTATGTESSQAELDAATSASSVADTLESSSPSRVAVPVGQDDALSSDASTSEVSASTSGSDAGDASEVSQAAYTGSPSSSDLADASESALTEASLGSQGTSLATSTESSSPIASLGASGVAPALADESGSAESSYGPDGSSLATASESSVAESTLTTNAIDDAVASESGTSSVPGGFFSEDSALASESAVAEAAQVGAASSVALASEPQVGHEVVATQAGLLDPALGSESLVGPEATLSSVPVLDSALSDESSTVFVDALATSTDASDASESSVARYTASPGATDSADASESGTAVLVGADIIYSATGSSTASSSESSAAQVSVSTFGLDESVSSESSVGSVSTYPVGSVAADASESSAALVSFSAFGLSSSDAFEVGLTEAELVAPALSSAFADEYALNNALLLSSATDSALATEDGSAIRVAFFVQPAPPSRTVVVSAPRVSYAGEAPRTSLVTSGNDRTSVVPRGFIHTRTEG